MAEDGMLMNFDLGQDPLHVRPIFKGGRWRDRLQAKKNLQRRQQKNQSNGALTGSNAEPTKTREPTAANIENARPLKKQKLNNTSHSSHAAHKTISKPKEVVSSLFTYNPTSKTTHSTTTQQDDLPAPSPSNAPLPPTTSPFTSLGLSPFLSTTLTESLKLTAPTAIQKAAISKLLAEDSDAFIQAETGSGKTLAYLLPIIQRIIALSTDSSKIDRKSGLFALILAPTRELTHQISTVLTRLLRPLPHIVAGTVTGGSTKNHEKSRIRKGLNILVATPGRLVDHLEHTEALDVGSVRWLVLDEGDRLMELGFEEDIRAIVKKLNDRKDAPTRVNESPKKEVGGLPEKRRTVLCSATMKMGVQKLGEISLKDAVHIKAEPLAASDTDASPITETESNEKKEKPFLAPAQLRQSYVITPAKQRLVTLAALLKHTFARKGSVMKAIIFVSCADSVDFHFEVFARKEEETEKEATKNSKSNRNGRAVSAPDASPTPEGTSRTVPERISKSELPTVAPASNLSSIPNPNVMLYKLHGSLEQKLRTATLQSFTKSHDPAILVCTDVASRGLDLPNIDLVIEYDPPFSADDHLHRIGRTARAGKEGRACCFLMPGEEEGYVSVLKECTGESAVRSETAENILRKGFGRSKCTATLSEKWHDRATEWHLDVERWVIDDERAGEKARKAFISHVRAYATHVAKEREIFDVKALHLGHLAKAFGLRERPGDMGIGGGVMAKDSPLKVKRYAEKRRVADGDSGGGGGSRSKEVRRGKSELDFASSAGQDAARKMRAKMKEHMGSTNEFNIG
ncbi:ATP-dependent RNA helicase dbp7 [Lecanora helva]